MTQLGGTVTQWIFITIAVNLVDCDITEEIFLFHFLDILDKHSYLMVTRLVFSSCLSSEGDDRSNATVLWICGGLALSLVLAPSLSSLASVLCCCSMLTAWFL